MYIDNKKWGQVRWGLTATPIYDITKDTNVTELEDDINSDNRMNQAFFLRPKGSNTEAGLSNLRWSDISRCYDSSTLRVIDAQERRRLLVARVVRLHGLMGLVRRRHVGRGAPLQERVGRELGRRRWRRLREDDRRAAADWRRRLRWLQADIQDWAGSASIKHKPTVSS
jgi:hypothetical protein